MDTSEQYIKMRVMAIDDLGMGTPPVKSPPCFISDTVWVDAVGNWYLIYHQGKEDAVVGCQLERQDQLQEMVFDKSNNPDTERAEQITHFYHFCMQPYRQQFTSMEQLWLAFYMSEKYDKMWNGTEWVKK